MGIEEVKEIKVDASVPEEDEMEIDTSDGEYNTPEVTEIETEAVEEPEKVDNLAFWKGLFIGLGIEAVAVLIIVLLVKLF